MKAETPETIPDFSGNQSDYHVFRQQFLQAAKHGDTHDEQGLGLLGFVLPAAEYLLEIRDAGIVAAAFEPIAHPGPAPILPNGANAAAIQLYGIQVSIHKDVKANRKAQQQNLSNLILQVVKATPAQCLVEIAHHETGMRDVSIAQYYVHMQGLFNVMSPTDLDENLKSLSDPYDESQDLATFIAKHRSVHATQLANLQQVTQAAKVKFFKEAMAPCGLFDNRIENWVIAHPTVVLQTFDLLQAAVLEYDKNRKKTMTTKLAGYSASVVPTSLSTLQNQMSAIAASIALIQSNAPGSTTSHPQRQPRQSGRGPAQGRGGRIGGGRQTRPWHYCWSHGLCHHLGRASATDVGCQNKAVGHQDNATLQNQMGGVPA